RTSLVPFTDWILTAFFLAPLPGAVSSALVLAAWLGSIDAECSAICLTGRCGQRHKPNIRRGPVAGPLFVHLCRFLPFTSGYGRLAGSPLLRWPATTTNTKPEPARSGAVNSMRFGVQELACACTPLSPFMS